MKSITENTSFFFNNLLVHFLSQCSLLHLVLSSVASQAHLSGQSPGQMGTPIALSISGQKLHKPQKKKLKTMSPLSMSAR